MRINHKELCRIYMYVYNIYNIYRICRIISDIIFYSIFYFILNSLVTCNMYDIVPTKVLGNG